jgi:hypothetical protein
VQEDHGDREADDQSSDIESFVLIYRGVFHYISFVFDGYLFTDRPPQGAILSLAYWRAWLNPSFNSLSAFLEPAFTLSQWIRLAVQFDVAVANPVKLRRLLPFTMGCNPTVVLRPVQPGPIKLGGVKERTGTLFGESGMPGRDNLPGMMGSFPRKQRQPLGVNERLDFTDLVGCAGADFWLTKPVRPRGRRLRSSRRRSRIL